MEKIHVKPCEGRAVIDPKTKQWVGPEGIKVELDSFWVRRLNDKDVVQVGEEEPAKKGGK